MVVRLEKPVLMVVVSTIFAPARHVPMGNIAEKASV
jgi:hypothetical protein